MENRLKEIRKTLGLTQTQLAELCDSSLQMIQYLENGQRQITPKWMEKFAEVLKIEPWMLWVNPQTIINDRDRMIISLYHAASVDTQKAVDSILGIDNPGPEKGDQKARMIKVVGL